MDVTFTDYTEMPDYLKSSRSQHVVLVIGESLRRSHDDRVTSVCAERVKVFHVTANNCVLRAKCLVPEK